MLSTETLTFLRTPHDESIDPLSVAPAGVDLRVWETKAEAYMPVQQIGLGCKSSKKSLFTKAARFSKANAVDFFPIRICLSLYLSHLPVSVEG